MELKIKSNNQESMEFIRNILFEKQNDLLVEEEYDHSDGFCKEPVVIAIILALGTAKVFETISQMFESYMKYKTEKIKLLSASDQKHNEKLEPLKVQLLKDNKVITIDEEDFVKIKSFDELKKKFI